MDWMLHAQALLGIVVFVALALPFSRAPRNINWKLVGSAILLQFAICFVLLKVPVISAGFAYLTRAVNALSAATLKGTSFIFGFLGCGATPFEVTNPNAVVTFAFQVLPLVIIMMIPAVVKSGRIEELKPILRSGWLNIHTSLAILGDAAFAFAFVVSVMYLIQERQLKSKRLGAIFHRLPPLDVMDTIGYKALTFGWPLFTLGMITGSIWAESAWGSYWTWYPKETWSLMTWAVYLPISHLRTLGWRGKKMALLPIVGFVFLLISFYVISRLPLGRHNF